MSCFQFLLSLPRNILLIKNSFESIFMWIFYDRILLSLISNVRIKNSQTNEETVGFYKRSLCCLIQLQFVYMRFKDTDSFGTNSAKNTTNKYIFILRCWRSSETKCFVFPIFFLDFYLLRPYDICFTAFYGFNHSIDVISRRIYSS